MSNEPTQGDGESGLHLPAGYCLQEYVITRTLGEGGFGITYLARDRNLDKSVAIKEFFPFEIATRFNKTMVGPQTNTADKIDNYKKYLGSFVDEARTLARFDHPNVVKVLRYFEENNSAYIIMEYVPGLNLLEWLRKHGKMDESQLKPILRAVAEGLRLLHRHDVLHRDIKPANIILRDDHTPVLIDFGAARKAIGRSGRSVTAMWTVGYTPIEQISETGEMGPYSDIYALGATAYMALVGRSPSDCVSRFQHDDLVPAQIAAQDRASPQFLQAIDWAIRTDRRDRPQSIDEWLTAFDGGTIPPSITNTASNPFGNAPTAGVPVGGLQAAKNQSTATTATPAPPSRLPVIAGVVAAVLVAVVVYIGFIKSDSADKPETSASEEKMVPAPSSKPAPEDPSDLNDFKRAQMIDIPEAYAIYLRLHPNGKFVADARAEAEQVSRSRQ